MEIIKKLSMTKNEFEEYKLRKRTIEHVLNRNKLNIDSQTYLNKIIMAITRDIQAKRLPPNTPVPSRRKSIDYLKTLYSATNNLKVAIASLLIDGAWTSSGGSFKLAEDNNYDIVEILKQKQNPCFLEIGAGYAGFKSKPAQGIAKLYSELKDEVNVVFTNLTKWHENLPKNIVELPGYTAIMINKIKEIPNIPHEFDIIYSQAATYFEPHKDIFMDYASNLLKDKGLLIFNAEENTKIESTKQFNLKDKIPLEGLLNGVLYVFEK